MERQALEIASWAENVYVKVPIINCRRSSSTELIRGLSARGVKLNVTALMTLEQLRAVIPALNVDVPSYVSMFAGRIADTGVDPLPLMAQAAEMLRAIPSAGLVWASSRELLNIFQAEAAGCHAITLTTDILSKVFLIGHDLADFSLETVKMFHDDAQSAGFTL
jgi:transaldolase